MAIRYNKRWKILIDKKMKKKDLQEAAHITHYQMMKLARDEKHHNRGNWPYLQSTWLHS